MEEVSLKCKEETLYDYLVQQKIERELVIEEYKAAKEHYEIAKARFESYGDMSAVENEIKKLEKFIEQVKPVEVEENQFSITQADLTVAEEATAQPTQTVTITCDSNKI